MKPSNLKVRTFISEAGGPDEFRRLLLLFYQKMSTDILIGFFFDGKDIPLTARRQAEFILAAGGFIDRFEGRGPASAHTALPPILSGHFDRRLQILREVLVENQVPPSAIEAWVQFEEGFREVVVTSE